MKISRLISAGVLGFLIYTDGAYAQSSVSITNDTVVEFKGWGLMPAPYDREMPTYADGSAGWHDQSWLPKSGTTPTDKINLVTGLNFDIARVYISPLIGQGERVLNQARLQDLKDHLTVLRNGGIEKYYLTLWSPPPYMKTPNEVRYGTFNGQKQTLKDEYADGSGYDLSDYIVQVIQALTQSGLPAPIAVSIQNEPDIAPVYDGAVYQTAQQTQNYRQVVKNLNTELNAAGFPSVKIISTESSALLDISTILGTPSNTGFSHLHSDSAFRDALDGFAWHTYATAGNIRTLNSAMAAYPTKERWMTEYSGDGGIRPELRANSGNEQLNWALNFVRRMAGDIVDTRSNYWFFWRGYRMSNTPGAEDLVYDGGTTKAYHVFKALWTAVHGGDWKVKKMTSSDPSLRVDNTGLIESGSGDQWSAPVDLIGFESKSGLSQVVLLANSTSSEKRISSLNGLKGTRAVLRVSDRDRDMATAGTRSIASGSLQGGELVLPAFSITLLSTTAESVPTPIPPTASPTRVPTLAPTSAPTSPPSTPTPRPTPLPTPQSTPTAIATPTATKSPLASPTATVTSVQLRVKQELEKLNNELAHALRHARDAFRHRSNATRSQSLRIQILTALDNALDASEKLAQLNFKPRSLAGASVPAIRGFKRSVERLFTPTHRVSSSGLRVLISNLDRAEKAAKWTRRSLA